MRNEELRIEEQRDAHMPCRESFETCDPLYITTGQELCLPQMKPRPARIEKPTLTTLEARANHSPTPLSPEPTNRIVSKLYSREENIKL